MVVGEDEDGTTCLCKWKWERWKGMDGVKEEMKKIEKRERERDRKVM